MLLIVVLIDIEKTETNCKDNWIEHASSCYLFVKHPRPISWFESEKYCVGEGGHLVSIGNEAEMNFIHYNLIEMGWTSYRRTFIGINARDDKIEVQL